MHICVRAGPVPPRVPVFVSTRYFYLLAAFFFAPDFFFLEPADFFDVVFAMIVMGRAPSI
jgi:hypothetical protein